tara:strand:- start:17137 stop:18177 length:1041 start_codon:yes stop_codon:yes gene_type:complete
MTLASSPPLITVRAPRPNMSGVAALRVVCVHADGAATRGASGSSRERSAPAGFAARPFGRRRRDFPIHRTRTDSIRVNVAEKKAQAGDVDEEETRYREMMKQTKEWMAYDPDEVPDSHPAPWETHVRNLMENGPWPCWNADLPESHFEPEPEFVPFNEAPTAYSQFDDKAKLWKEKVVAERAEMTRVRQSEIRQKNWMAMDRDIRLADVPSCDESGWSHDKIMDLIGYPEEVQQAMEEYSVHIYDPRFPIDNTWIAPPEPDTWEFIRKIGHAGVEGEDEVDVGDRLAVKNGINQRYDTEASDGEFLNQTSEAKLARAIDIGEEDDADEEADALAKGEKEKKEEDSD